MTYEIELTDRQHLVALDRERICQSARDLLAAERVASAIIGLVFVDDTAIHRINREHLQHDYPTDVISFLLEERPNGRPDVISTENPRGAGKHLEGEIVVSTETALKQAENYGWSAEEELLLYVVHGMLHLAGYDDLTAGEKAEMRRRENEILARWGMTPPRDQMDDEPHPDRTTLADLPREDRP
ncbi:MAG TPA: rRNA maturation RNase YbeY [Planctomycetaceae bacterium]|nr:rRNA maturation RNase YbeY [Planctomycetaceae bacterium]